MIKKLGIIVATLAVAIALGIAVIYALSSTRMNKKYQLIVAPVTVPKDEDSVKEGQRLFVSRGCADCHGLDLSGVTFVDNPAIGRFTGANLTSGKGGAAGSRSDSDFAHAIRHGIAAGGRALIMMPATDYQGMSDEDVGRIIAYVRSAPPVDKESLPQSPGPVARLLFLAGKMPILVTAEVIDHQLKPPAQVIAGQTLEYGRYVAAMCTGCHGEGYSGGAIPGGPPDWPHATNITPAGIGKWSEADFIKAIRTGVRPDGTTIKPPMPWPNMSSMNDVELKALWMYLRSVPEKATGNH